MDENWYTNESAWSLIKLFLPGSPGWSTNIYIYIYNLSPSNKVSGPPWLAFLAPARNRGTNLDVVAKFDTTPDDILTPLWTLDTQYPPRSSCCSRSRSSSGWSMYLWDVSFHLRRWWTMTTPTIVCYSTISTCSTCFLMFCFSVQWVHPPPPSPPPPVWHSIGYPRHCKGLPLPWPHRVAFLAPTPNRNVSMKR